MSIKNTVQAKRNRKNQPPFLRLLEFYFFKCCLFLIFQNYALLFLAIISSLFGLMIALVYGISISTPLNIPRAEAFSYGMFILGVIQTFIGLMATVYSCLSCCGSTPATPVSFVVVIVVVVVVFNWLTVKERHFISTKYLNV